MSQPSSRRRPSTSRSARRSLVELTALASRAVRDDLPVASAGSVAAVIDRAQAAEATAEMHVGEPEGAKGELHTSDSTAELAVRIAKEFQARVLEDLWLSMNAALDYGKGSRRGARIVRRSVEREPQAERPNSDEPRRRDAVPR
jgi:hypothetical protein